jgi:uncharacterized protein YbjT (DUF2867 family)
MRLLVFGATGRTGRRLTALAGQGGIAVHAAGRDPGKLAALAGVASWSTVDVIDADATLKLIRSAEPDAIVSAVGGAFDGRFVDEVGNIVISDAALSAGVRRLILVSSLACGDSRAYASERLLAAIGPVLDAKTRAEDHLRRLDLDWTIIRPGGLTDGEATGGGALYEDPRIHGRIACADLAELILACLTTAGTVRNVLSAVDRATLSGPSDPREFAATRFHSIAVP